MDNTSARGAYRKLFSAGVGGIRCNCCRPFGCHTVKEARILINRAARRQANRDIRAFVKTDIRAELAE